MTRPDFVPEPAWAWIEEYGADVPGLLSADMRPSWEVWARMVDSEFGWRLLADFLFTLPESYRPAHIGKPERLRDQLFGISDDLTDLIVRMEAVRREALDIGAGLPFTDDDIATLDRLQHACNPYRIAPLMSEDAYLDARRKSAQAFVQHFDDRWSLYKFDPDVAQLQFSHADVARIAEATRLAACTPDAVRKARQRNPDN